LSTGCVLACMRVTFIYAFKTGACQDLHECLDSANPSRRSVSRGHQQRAGG
jgi:hypothetical protein